MITKVNNEDPGMHVATFADEVIEGGAVPEYENSVSVEDADEDEDDDPAPDEVTEPGYALVDDGEGEEEDIIWEEEEEDLGSDNVQTDRADFSCGEDPFHSEGCPNCRSIDTIRPDVTEAVNESLYKTVLAARNLILTDALRKLGVIDPLPQEGLSTTKGTPGRPTKQPPKVSVPKSSRDKTKKATKKTSKAKKKTSKAKKKTSKAKKATAPKKKQKVTKAKKAPESVKKKSALSKKATSKASKNKPSKKIVKKKGK